MKVLVTGASGFAGQALAQHLARDATHLRVTASRQAAGAALLPGVEQVSVGDLSRDTCWHEAVAGCEAIVHLAARVHVMREQAADALAAFRCVNTDGTLNLARQAASAGVRRFVFLSSIKVNGEQTTPGCAFLSTDVPNPQDPYAISKYEAEAGLRTIAARTGMEVVIIRPPLIYGPGVKANFAALMRAVARGVPLPLGSIENRRSLLALDNLVDFILTCLNSAAAANRTFVVCDGEDLSTPELVRRMARAMDRPARLLPIPASVLIAGATFVGKRAAVERLCGNLQIDNREACETLGWRAPIGVDEGLRRAVAGMTAPP